MPRQGEHIGSTRPLRLGTRASLLAIAQSQSVVRALRAADPGLQIELVLMSTRGDRDQSTPLSASRDPGFFSDDLDQALRRNDVDFCVHSLKDLPLAPRAGLQTAAIAIREDPRDVVVFRAEVLERLRLGKPLRIGSSSARRTKHVRDFLQSALPTEAPRLPDLQILPVRGAVHDRLGRIKLPEADPAALDGVVLALAGLNRLWSDRDGHAAIQAALQGARMMVLPLSACPTAPGQGALALECRSGDHTTAATLSVLNDAASARRARRELALLAAQPEDERGGFAATSVRSDSCGTVIFIRGTHLGREFSRVIWKKPSGPGQAKAWDGIDWVRKTRYRVLRRVDLRAGAAVFVAHWRAVNDKMRLPPGTRVWVSGVTSWRRLAARGLWVEGCADNLGFASIAGTLASPVLRLPSLADWTVFTRSDAVSSWRGSGVGHVIPTYSIGIPADEPALDEIRRSITESTHFYWGSAAQFLAVRDWLPTKSHHACGPGKTYQQLLAAGVDNLQPFPSREEWRRWVA
jgi:hydroxymethylbilane synthase